MNGRLGRWLLLIGALGFAVLGQFYFATKPEFFWDGVAFYAVAVVLFLILVRGPSQRLTRVEPPESRLSPALVIRRLLVGVALLLALVVVLQLAQSQKNHWPIFWMWIAGIICYLLAFARLPMRWTTGADVSGEERGLAETTRQLSLFEYNQGRPLKRERLRQWVTAHGWEIGLAVLLVMGAWVLRAWRIDTIPWTLGGDEGSQGMWARDVIEGRQANMFGLGWLAVPNMSFYWQALWFKLFGDDLIGLRLPWALVGTLTVLGAYLLVRRLFDVRLAVLTAFLLATYHYHIHYSRLGSNQIADPLFTVWALYFLVIGWQSSVNGGGKPGGSGRWAWALSGIITGLAFFFYAGSRQVPIILLAVVLWAALTETYFLREQGRNLLVMLGGFVVSVGPMALLALRDPDNFNARLNQVGLFQSGLIDRVAAQTKGSRWSVLAEQFRKAFFAFNYFNDRVTWYAPPGIPLMDFASSIFFVLGAAVSVARMMKWRYAVFVIWFVLVIVLGAALTENPPSSQRLVSSVVPAVFFVAVALRQLTLTLRDLLRLPELGRRVLVGGLALALALISVRYYFGPYQESWVYGSFNAEVATRVGYYLRELGPAYNEYFFGAPRMYANFGSTPFIAKGNLAYDVKQPLVGAPSFVDPKRKAVFVFLPERINELAIIQQAYPNGVTEQVRRIGAPDGPLLFTAYRVDSQ